jgi:8-oxo-dGTP pyrophosphatase MutT (NUDIX family)
VRRGLPTAWEGPERRSISVVRVIERQAARLVVVSSLGRLLLLRLEPESRDGFWVTPGGGLDEGESFEEAAARELFEEVGRDDLTVGPCVWTQKVAFTWDDWRVTQFERSYLVQAEEEFDSRAVEPGIEPITGSAWFGVDDLNVTDEVIYPTGIGALLARLLTDGPPSEPISLPDSIEDEVNPRPGLHAP